LSIYRLLGTERGGKKSPTGKETRGFDCAGKKRKKKGRGGGQRGGGERKEKVSPTAV